MSIKNRLQKLEHDTASRKPDFVFPDSILKKFAGMTWNRDIQAECKSILNDPSASPEDKERASRGIAPLKLDYEVIDGKLVRIKD